MNPKLKAALDELIPVARFNLEHSGRLLPVAFIFGKDYSTAEIVGCPWKNDVEKEAAVLLLRERCRKLDACAIAMLSEAWWADLHNVKSLDDWDGTPASEQPNRKEVVLIYVEELDGCWRGTADITRSGGRPSFGEIKWEPYGERAECERFQRILA